MMHARRGWSDRQPRPEDQHERGRRYLTEGRLTILAMDGLRVRALCVGHRSDYELGYDAGEGWWCSCGSLGDCAHVVALRLVVERGLVPASDS